MSNFDYTEWNEDIDKEKEDYNFEGSIKGSENIILSLIFPIFLMSLGAIVLLISILFSENLFTFIVGGGVFVLGLIWEIIASLKVKNKRKKDFLRFNE